MELPATPELLWSESADRGIWTWVSGLLAVFGRVSGKLPAERRGEVRASRNGLTIADDDRRFVPWSDIDSIEPCADGCGVAALRLRTGRVVELGPAHLPTGDVDALARARLELLQSLLVSARSE